MFAWHAQTKPGDNASAVRKEVAVLVNWLKTAEEEDEDEEEEEEDGDADMGTVRRVVKSAMDEDSEDGYDSGTMVVGDDDAGDMSTMKGTRC